MRIRRNGGYTVLTGQQVRDGFDMDDDNPAITTFRGEFRVVGMMADGRYIVQLPPFDKSW